MHVRLYTNSLLATFLSIGGSMSLLGGIGMLFTGQILPGIFLIALTFGFFFGAEKVSAAKEKKQTAKKQKKYQEDSKLPEKLAKSCLECLYYINVFPTEEGLETVRKYNPYAASQLQRLLNGEITYDALTLDFRMTDIVNKKNRKKGNEFLYSGSSVSVTELEEKYAADERKYKSNRLIKNIICIAIIPVVILGFWISTSLRPDRVYVEYEHLLAEKTYTAVDIIAIKSITINDLDTEYECVFVDKNNISGVINLPKWIYGLDNIKPIIEAMDDLEATPEPITFYGRVTKEIPDDVKQWAENNNYDISQLAPIRIDDGSNEPQKGHSIPGYTLLIIGLLLMVIGFVCACSVNLQKNKLKSFANKIEFERNQESVLS